MSSDAVSPIERLLEVVERALGPYLRRICEPEPAVYAVAQAAVVLQVSEDTIARLVRRGVLSRVPHVDGKVLIPRMSIDELVGGPVAPRPATSETANNVSRLRSAAGP